MDFRLWEQIIIRIFTQGLLLRHPLPNTAINIIITVLHHPLSPARPFPPTASSCQALPPLTKETPNYLPTWNLFAKLPTFDSLVWISWPVASTCRKNSLNATRKDARFSPSMKMRYVSKTQTKKRLAKPSRVSQETVYLLLTIRRLLSSECDWSFSFHQCLLHSFVIIFATIINIRITIQNQKFLCTKGSRINSWSGYARI